MRTPRRGRGASRGYSLLEMAIVVTLIGILIVVATDRLMLLRAAAERAAVERTLATLRTVIVLELAGRLVDGSDPGALDGANPMALWDKHVEYPLPRYAGVRDDAAAVPPGSWSYRPDEHVLVYRTLVPEAFRSDGPDPARARFRMALSYAPDGRPAGIRLEPLDEFAWNAKKLAEIVVK
jgi:prepilin-type N-terminal cleavage/methylation domain-containing protein